MTAPVLTLLAVLLAGPVPALLARLPAVRRAPRAAMVLWQSVALAAVLAALGATLALTTSSGLGADRGVVGHAVAALSLLVTAVVVGRLLLTGHRVGRRLRGMRRRHRELIDLMASVRDGIFVIDGDDPVAYCLPGLAGHRVVVTRGATDLLADDELAAVVAHERAHLAARHDLVLEAFTVLHQAFPRWVSSRDALVQVRLLTEVLADAASRRRYGALPLARALVTLSEGNPLGSDLAPVRPASPSRARRPGARVALAAGGELDQLTARVQLLRDRGTHRVLAAALLVSAAAVLVLPTVFVAYPWLTSLA